MKYPVFFILALLLFSCGEKSESPTTRQVEISLTDEINIDVSEALGSYGKYFLVEDEQYLITYNDFRSGLALDLFDWKKKQFIESVPMRDIFLKEGFFTSTVYAINRDSVVFFDSNKHLMIFNMKNKSVTSKIDLSTYLPEPYIVGYENLKPIIKNGQILFRVQKDNHTYFDQEFYQSPYLAILDLNELSKAKLVGEFPASYQEMDDTYFLNSQRLAFGFGLDGTSQIVSSFRSDPALHVNNIDQNTFIEAPSQYMSKPSKFTQEEINNSSDSWITEGHYNGIIAHPELNIYYRFYVPAQELLNSQGEKNNPASRPFSVQVLDENFKVLEEKLFDYNETKLDFLVSFLAKDGLYFAIENGEEDIMTFKS